MTLKEFKQNLLGFTGVFTLIDFNNNTLREFEYFRNKLINEDVDDTIYDRWTVIGWSIGFYEGNLYLTVKIDKEEE